MNSIIKNILPAAALLLTMGMTSCVGDLDPEVLDPNKSTEYDATGLFNKCYANFAMEGNEGGGTTDIVATDAGFTGLVRQMWNANELPTDEAVCGWGDAGISTFIQDSYDASHPMLAMYYNRLTIGIDYCNQYLNVASEVDATKTAEVRLLRALQYYLLMDAFGNVPFGTTLAKPVQYSRQEMYDWLDKELAEIEPQLSEAKAKKSNDAGYGRLDKAACWMLQARLYLNAKVYTGKEEWAKAAACAKKVMDSSYKLNTSMSANHKWSAYQMLFMADNGESSAATEGVFPILQDGLKTQAYGCSFFLIASTFSDDMHANREDAAGTNNTTGAWSGNRARRDLINKFFDHSDAPMVPSYEMTDAAGDDRALFWGKDRTLDAEKTSDFKSGFSVAKFINYRSDGQPASDAQYADMDFFFFRVAEAYLDYAEALTRQAGGIAPAEAVKALNALRTRARANTKAEWTLNDICDEWSREFYFEGLRRPTLIRFDRFGGNNGYKWQWKGGSFSGKDFEAFRNVFAIPTTDLTANKNMKQNVGY
jgi:hypothetical protein